MTVYAKHFSTRETPQSEPIPGKVQVENSAGGFAFQVDDWARLDRFLIIGSCGGTYYVNEKKLTVDNATAIVNCIKQDGAQAVRRIVEISEAGRAPKNAPAIFSLALAASIGSPETKAVALAAVPKVCRIGTHLFQFAESVQSFRGWGRGLRRAIAAWYTSKQPDDIAYQCVKYQQRNGWSHRDLLRLSKPKGVSGSLGSVLRWSVGKPFSDDVAVPEIILAFEKAKIAKAPAEIANLIREHNLPRECVPTEHLNNVGVWEALLEKMPMTAMIRNLAKMTAVGLLSPMSAGVGKVLQELANVERIRKSRLHPMAILMALRTYASGHGDKGKLSWTPVPQIIDALNEAFYAAFANAEPTGKRWLLGIDVSGSMSGAMIGGTSLSACEAATAMAMVTAHVEPQYHFYAFSDTFRPLPISKGMRLDDALQHTRNQNFGGTDCALPMVYALQNKISVDAFTIYTDNETWAGSIHPCQALTEYREKMGIQSKLIVCGMTSTGFTIADPSDLGSLDVVGFDAATPNVMADFVK